MYPILLSNTERKKTVKPFISIPLLGASICILLAAGTLTSCGTVGGFGQDVETTGNIIEDAAN
jgi:predicted small secreted protein